MARFSGPLGAVIVRLMPAEEVERPSYFCATSPPPSRWMEINTSVSPPHWFFLGVLGAAVEHTCSSANRHGVSRL